MRQHSGIGVLDKAVGVLRVAAVSRAAWPNCASAPGFRGPPHTGWPPAWRCTPAAPRRRRAAGGSVPRSPNWPGDVNDPLLAAAAAVLPRLRDITGESVQLYRREGTQRVCVAALEPAAGFAIPCPSARGCR